MLSLKRARARARKSEIQGLSRHYIFNLIHFDDPKEGPLSTHDDDHDGDDDDVDDP